MSKTQSQVAVVLEREVRTLGALFFGSVREGGGAKAFQEQNIRTTGCRWPVAVAVQTVAWSSWCWLGAWRAAVGMARVVNVLRWW